ncbi:MAG: hypothetical protein L0287_24780 [Anaerolineae bacterium]|nr:hypothetical protein [Anaerolineae bacterium]
MRTSIAKIFEGLTQEKHTVKALARNHRGEPVEACSSEAVKWCAAGWLQNRYPASYDLIIQRINVRNPNCFIGQDNDQFGYPFIEHLQSMDEEFELWYREPNE